MAILHNKEHKIASVIEKLPKKYSDDQFVEQFIKMFSKEWGKIKSAYIKQSQDKEVGAVVNMPKPELYLKQLLKNFVRQESEKADVNKIVEAATETVLEDKPKKAAKKVDVAKPEVVEQSEKVTDIVEKPKKASKKISVAKEEIGKPSKKAADATEKPKKAAVKKEAK